MTTIAERTNLRALKVARVVVACNDLVELKAAERAEAFAVSVHWRGDPAGRRSRAARYRAALRRERKAMAALIALVQAPDAPEEVRDHFATNGPTYHEAAKAAFLMLYRFGPHILPPDDDRVTSALYDALTSEPSDALPEGMGHGC